MSEPLGTQDPWFGPREEQPRQHECSYIHTHEWGRCQKADRQKAGSLPQTVFIPAQLEKCHCLVGIWSVGGELENTLDMK